MLAACGLDDNAVQPMIVFDGLAVIFTAMRPAQPSISLMPSASIRVAAR